MRLLPLVFTIAIAAAQPRQVVITIDDLPRGGDNASANDLVSIRAMTAKLLKPLKGTHAMGFVNPGRVPQIGEDGLQSILRMWLGAGLELGNHSHTHRNINQIPLAEYTADILKAETALQQATGKRPVYYRHAFLFTGKDEATKSGLAQFLQQHNYTVAPVTIDNSDWLFAAVYADALKKDTAQAAKIRQTYLVYMASLFAFFESAGKKVAGEDFPQILLIHANQLNADSMPDLLQMIGTRGYEFVSLEQALRHPAYRLADGYTGTSGISWIHRWGKAKGIPTPGEPPEPKEIMELFRNRSK
ncbi:MAG: polysaccharide deacetylase family protein [Acidobacteria bacterium]|nr:polysaccharide deacetylase family protein [Acidobacteriota bacterium]